MSNQNECTIIPSLPVNEVKVLDRVIDVYLWLNDLNTAEVIRLGQQLINLANRRATDVELYYQNNRITDMYYISLDGVPGEDITDIFP